MTRNIKRIQSTKDESKDMVVGYTVWQDSQYGDCCLVGLLPNSDPNITYDRHIEEVVYV